MHIFVGIKLQKKNLCSHCIHLRTKLLTLLNYLFWICCIYFYKKISNKFPGSLPNFQQIFWYIIPPNLSNRKQKNSKFCIWCNWIITLKISECSFIFTEISFETCSYTLTRYAMETKRNFRGFTDRKNENIEI